MSTQALSTIPLTPRALITRGIMQDALIESFVKLLPQQQWKNPVMFVVYVGSILTTVLWFQALGGKGEAPAGFILAVTLWLWFKVVFANFAEAVPKRPSSGVGEGVEKREPPHRVKEGGKATEGSQSVARCLRRVAQGRG